MLKDDILKKAKRFRKNEFMNEKFRQYYLTYYDEVEKISGTEFVNLVDGKKNILSFQKPLVTKESFEQLAEKWRKYNL